MSPIVSTDFFGLPPMLIDGMEALVWLISSVDRSFFILVGVGGSKGWNEEAI